MLIVIMQKNKENIISELKIFLKNKYPEFSGIYFYGSQSKEESEIDSDYDLAFVFNKKINKKFKEEIIDLIYEFDLKYDIVIDVKIFSSDEISDPVTPFRANVKNEGIFYGV